MDITVSYPLVWVRWLDSWQLDGWTDTEIAIDKCKATRLTIESTGRLIYDGEKRLVLVSDMAEDGQHVNHQIDDYPAGGRARTAGTQPFSGRRRDNQSNEKALETLSQEEEITAIPLHAPALSNPLTLGPQRV